MTPYEAPGLTNPQYRFHERAGPPDRGKIATICSRRQIEAVSYRRSHALAGAAFFKDYGSAAGVMSSVVAVLTSLMTFLKPSERAAAHKGSGDQYLTLRNDARVFREIRLYYACDEQAAMAQLDEFTKRRNELNQASAQFSRADFELARKGIDEGEGSHRVDQAGGA